MTASQSSLTRISTRRALSVVGPLTGVVVGWLLCELLLRVLSPPPIYYSTWFTAGVHQPDGQFGFVFRPLYDGAMRNIDQVWMQPIRLDDSGLRLPARSPVTDAPDAVGSADQTRMVLLGGASMAFSFGLSDEESLHHQIATQLGRPCQIDLMAWPGFTLGQDIQKLQRFKQPGDYDLAVIFAYGHLDYVDQQNWDQLPMPGSLEMVDSVVAVADPAASLVGNDWYYRSYVVAGLCRLLRVPIAVWDRNAGVDSNSNASVGVTDAAQVPTMVRAARRLRELGIGKVLIVALPRMDALVGPDSLTFANATDVEVLDLRREFATVASDDGFSPDWIASGHYGPRSAKRLANRIAKQLSQLAPASQ